MTIRAGMTWDDNIRPALRSLAGADDAIADAALERAAEHAADHARANAPGSLDSLVGVERRDAKSYAVVGRQRAGSDRHVFNMHEYGTLSKRVKKKRTRNATRPGGIRPKRMLHRGRAAAVKLLPGFLVDAIVDAARARGFDSRPGG